MLGDSHGSDFCQGENVDLPGQNEKKVIEARKRAVAREYRWKDKQRRNSRPKPPFRVIRNAKRANELMALVNHRGAPIPPDNEPAYAALKHMLWHGAKAHGVEWVRCAIDHFAPWMPQDERDELIGRLGAVRPLKAKALGKLVRLIEEERAHLKITTFQSIDGPSSEERKLARDKERQRQKRRDAGAIPRDEYLRKSNARTRPWERPGMNRTKYYRLGLHLIHETGETGPSPANTSLSGSDGVVSRPSDRVDGLAPHSRGKVRCELAARPVASPSGTPAVMSATERVIRQHFSPWLAASTRSANDNHQGGSPEISAEAAETVSGGTSADLGPAAAAVMLTTGACHG